MSGTRIVQLNRRTREFRDETGVVKKSGVSPASIPDYLAVVGDAADGYAGLPGWGAKPAAAVLAKFIHINSIPVDFRQWRVNAANASALSDQHNRALLFRTLVTLRTDIPLFTNVDELRWGAVTPTFETFAARFDGPGRIWSGPSAVEAINQTPKHT